MMWRNTLNFQSIFHDFFVRISSKIMRKSWKTVLCTNIVKELTFGAPCVRTVAIFRWFLGARGALGTSRQRRRRRPFFNEFSVACGNRPRLVPGTPQGGSREAPGVPQAPPAQHFASILDRFSGWISTLAMSEIYWIFAWSVCFFFFNFFVYARDSD